MLRQSIGAWLLNPDNYPAGLALLQQTGLTGFTMGILTKGEDAYTRTRLEAELRKWVEKQNNVLPPAPAAARLSEENSVVPDISTKAPIIPKNQSRPDQEPDAVLQIRKQIYQLMDQRADSKASLRAMERLGNDDTACAARLPHALGVKRITRQIDELYSRLAFFETNGYLPPLASDAAVIVDDQTALLNARSYVSRYKAKLKKKTLTPEQRESAQKLLLQYTAEKQRLELKLSKPSKQNDSYSTGQQTTDRPIHSAPLSGA